MHCHERREYVVENICKTLKKFILVIGCILSFNTSGAANQVDCQFIGFEPTDKTRSNVSLMLEIIPVEALVQNMPWKGDVVPSIKTCSVSAVTGVIYISDFDGNALVYHLTKRIIGSIPRGSLNQLFCYDMWAKNAFRPTNGKCY